MQKVILITDSTAGIGFETAKALGPMVVAVNPGSLLGSKIVKDAYGIAGGKYFGNETRLLTHIQMLFTMINLNKLPLKLKNHCENLVIDKQNFTPLSLAIADTKKPRIV